MKIPDAVKRVAEFTEISLHSNLNYLALVEKCSLPIKGVGNKRLCRLVGSVRAMMDFNLKFWPFFILYCASGFMDEKWKLSDLGTFPIHSRCGFIVNSRASRFVFSTLYHRLIPENRSLISLNFLFRENHFSFRWWFLLFSEYMKKQVFEVAAYWWVGSNNVKG